ncbi:hypothetical protein XAP6164_3800007 [Xanthomonas phaseoli pv. phaseoli]|nr:hypothetical protein XAP6164_3800007 [Xanthomonas phaseoli pv. phaseoli]
MPNLERDEVVDERWKRRFIWQLHVFTKEIGFCESFLHVCRLNPVIVQIGIGQAFDVPPPFRYSGRGSAEIRVINLSLSVS